MKVNIEGLTEELGVLADNLFSPLASLKVALQGFEGAEADTEIALHLKERPLPEQLDDALTGSETKEMPREKVAEAISGLKRFLPLTEPLDSVATSLRSLEDHIENLRMKIKLLREERDKIDPYKLRRLLGLNMVDLSLDMLKDNVTRLDICLGCASAFGQQIIKAWKASEAKNDTGWRGGRLHLLLMYLYRELADVTSDMPSFKNSLGQLEGTIKQIHAKIEEMQK